MGRYDWYRRTTWSAADEAAFRVRLTRTRSNIKKAQCLRIQSQVLAEHGKLEVAAKLADEAIRDYPDRCVLALCHEQLAECLARRGRIDDAVSHFRESIRAERDYPQIGTTSRLNFPLLIATAGLIELYDEAIALLDEYKATFGRMGLVFQSHRYIDAAVRAIIHNARGEPAEARVNARIALEAKEVQHSGLSHHPTVGLVRQTDAKLEQMLAFISGE